MDVTAGLAWAFQEAGCATNVYMHLGLLGTRSVMDSWLKGELIPRDRIDEDQGKYDVLIMVTFPEGPGYQDRQRRLLLSRPPHQRILLGVHNPGWLLTATWPGAPQLLVQLVFPRSPAGGMRRGGRQQEPLAPPPVQLLALAPIGSAYTKALLQGWLAATQPRDAQLAGLTRQLEVPWIAPLVPWARCDAAPGSSEASGAASAAEQGYGGPLRHLCIQGTIDQKRRDYAGAFAAASHPAVLAQLRQRNESLLLVGTKKNTSMPVPPELEPHVRVLSSLAYAEYYATLSSCRAILTAFGSDQYLVNKTSSTLAAALQVGAPMLTEGRVLAAYEYVPRAAAFLYRPNDGTARPDPAALGKAEGKRLAQWMRQQAVEAKQRNGSMMRRLGEVRGPAAVMQQQSEEEGEEAAHWLAWEHASEEQRPQPRRQQQEQGQQEPASPPGQTATRHRAGEAGPPDPPPPGSYAAALLHAFDESAARAAHTAAWRAKLAAMQLNAETARRILKDAAVLAAAVQAGR